MSRTYLAILTFLAGCSMTPEESHDLHATDWNLIAITDPDLPIPAGQEYRLLFDTYGLLGARVDCNSAGGTYSVRRGGRIELKLDTSTYVDCGPESIDEEFYQLVNSTTRYEVQSGQLVLRTSGAEHRTMIFVRGSSANP